MIYDCREEPPLRVEALCDLGTAPHNPVKYIVRGKDGWVWSVKPEHDQLNQGTDWYSISKWAEGDLEAVS